MANYFLHLYAEDAPPGLLEHSAAIGLEPARGWMKFKRDVAPASARQTDLQVRRVGPEDALDFGRIVVHAFGMTEAAAPLLAGLASDPKWHLLVSYDGDTPAGAGGLYVSGDVAWTE